MRTLLYAVPAMNLTMKQNDYIMAPILMCGLNAMGMQKYMPRVVVYGPLKYQGLDIPNLHTECGIAHVKILLHECCQRLQTGQLAWMSLEAMKVEIGVAGSVLS
jgi:hypothetical protein